MFNKVSLLPFLFLIWNFSIAQEKQTDDDEQKIEIIAESIENEELDYTDLLERLNYYREKPLNLNSATGEELLDLQLLDEIRVNNLLTHIKNHGKLITIYELQSIPGYDVPTIRKILPFVMVSDLFEAPHFTLNEMFRNGRNQILLRHQRILEEQKGFTPISAEDLKKSPNSRYLGNRDKLYARYRFNYSTIVSWGITAEKDAGEEFFKGSQKNGFDFYSAHLFIKPNRFIKTVALGDYNLSFGQGLVAWSGLAFGKSADAINIKKNEREISPYTSVNENLFLRGGAVTIGTKKLKATAFFSQKKIDGNISQKDTINDEEVLAVSSLQETGYHSTPSEIEDKHALKQTVYGSNVSYGTNKLKVGLTGIHTLFVSELERNLSLYNKFEFTGRELTNAGADYSFIFLNANFFGEAAVSSNGGMAVINGLLLTLDPKVSFSLAHRHYQKEYQSFYANAFAESTIPANEKGIYAGITIKPINTVTISGYFDRFVFPWLKYRVNSPSYGTDYLTQINYTHSKKIDMYFRVRKRDKFVNTGADETIDFIVPLKQTNYRYHISYSVSPSVRMKNRVEFSEFDDSDKLPSNGFIVYHDITFKPLGKRISGSFHYALFQSDDYDSRLYAYEVDIPGSYSIPAYYDRGSRYYLLLNYNFSRNIEAWVRYSQTYYSNKKIISEGSLTEIKGNTRSDIKAQIRISF